MLSSSFALILALLLHPFPGKGPTVGSKSIDFTLNDFQGNKVSLSQLKGKVVLLDFWASWCPPCKEEMPYLDILQKTYGKAGFTVLAVNVDNNPKNALDFLSTHSIKLTSLWDSKKRVVSAYDVNTMPTSMLIDQEGWIRYIHSGFKAEDFQLFKKEIESLLKSKPRKPSVRRISRRDR